jgi:tetratricopeptide (TPR) repeat protein
MVRERLLNYRLAGTLLALPAAIGVMGYVQPIWAQATPITQPISRTPTTITGRLSSSSATFDDGIYYETQTFLGTADETLTFDLSSDNFDAYLILVSPSGEWIAQDDYSAEGTNARITLTLQSSGSYTLIVTSYGAGETGSYELHIRSANDAEKALDQANQFNQQAINLYQAGRYEEAESLYQRALEIREQNLAPNHPNIANSLSHLATLYSAQGFYREAESLHQRALEIYEQTLGPSHRDTTTVANNLAELYRLQGRYSEAESLHRRTLAIREQTLGPNHPNTATSLNNLAFLYVLGARYREAEPLYRRALNIIEQTLGFHHPNTALSLNNLADLYMEQGRYEEAEFFFKRALDIFENIPNSNRLNIALGLNNLAFLYQLQGRYGEAEPLFVRALAIREQGLDSKHPDIGLSQRNLASLYQLQGRYEEAESLFLRALEIHEQAFNPNHPSIATSLIYLAGLYRLQGRHEEAEPLLLRALEIHEQAFNPNHPSIATSLIYLAGLYRLQGRHEEAEPLLLRALEIYEQALSPNHRSIAVSRNNLANLYLSQGQYGKVEALYQDALSIIEQSLGAEHPDTATALLNLAWLAWTQDRSQTALNYLNRGISIEETVLSHNLIGGNDVNKQNYLTTVSRSTAIAISFNLTALPTHTEANYLAFSTLLQRKGRVLDIFTNLRSQLADDPAASVLFYGLNIVNNQLSALTSNPPDDPFAQDIYQAQLRDQQQLSRDLSDRLSRLSPDFAMLASSPSVDEVASALPTHTALVEFIRYRPANPSVLSVQEQFGEPHYAAYILHADGTPHGIDLGPASDIEAAVETLVTDLSTADSPIDQVKQNAQALDTLVMAPVRALLGNTKTVFLSPDAALNLIPFEALVDESEQYLVDQGYTFRYLTSGRDLMRLEGTVSSTNPAVLIGNPLYPRTEDLPARFRNQQISGLPGTQAEVEQIHALLPSAQVYVAADASEETVRQAARPSILHIATHGFFEADPNAINPLLQSGLFLAGGIVDQPEKDGILTALEVTGLDLRGTQLVVLSACETGIGELAAGEGVYGLRRALVLAGSQSQVISLWKVDDTATQELMVTYYEQLRAGRPRDEALRKTQLALLNNPDYEHPHYWAAFIGSGDWRPLELDN